MPVPFSHITVDVVEVTLDGAWPPPPLATYLKCSLARRGADGHLIEQFGSVQRSTPRVVNDQTIKETLTLPGAPGAKGLTVVLEVKSRPQGWLPFTPTAWVASCFVDCETLRPNRCLDAWFPLVKGQKSAKSVGSIRLALTLHMPHTPAAAPAVTPIDLRPPVDALPHPRRTTAWELAVVTASGGGLRRPDGSEYRGPLRDGLPHGRGEYRYKEEYVYVGDWDAGMKHGAGRLELPSGAYYHGSWRHGKKEGIGEARDPEEHYCGHYCNNRRHGLGILEALGDHLETRHVNGRLEAAVTLDQSQFQSILDCLREGRPYRSALLKSPTPSSS